MTSITKYEYLAAALADTGWCIYADFLPQNTVRQLAEEARQIGDAKAFHPARVGRAAALQAHPEIRGDHIHWLDHNRASPAQHHYLDELEQLRLAINRRMFLGLFDLETHLAFYPVGARYQKHLDQFQSAGQRAVSCILYLNEDWKENEGGQLRIYTSLDAPPLHVDIVPQGGTLVTFLSAGFYHEVLPATRPRLSVAGWFRTRG